MGTDVSKQHNASTILADKQAGCENTGQIQERVAILPLSGPKVCPDLQLTAVTTVNTGKSRLTFTLGGVHGLRGMRQKLPQVLRFYVGY
jgi:hypothetical protein